MDEYFDTQKFDRINLAEQLYSQKPGVVTIPGILKPDARAILLEEIHSNRDFLKRAKERYGKADQRFLMHYWGWHETGSDESTLFPEITKFSRAYNELSKSLVAAANLTQQRVSSTGIHIYWPDEKPGIDPHRDSSNVQLISSFVLEGFSPFYVADDYELKINKQLFEILPGDLMLMRGPKNEDERRLAQKGDNYNPLLDPRPIHCVGLVEQQRTVILFRHLKEGGNDAQRNSH